MSNSYWNSVLGSRLSRRRAITATGATAAAAAFLAACGGSSNKSSDGGNGAKSKDASGLLAVPTNTMAKATRGGTWPTTITADPPHFDSIGKYHTAAYAQNLMSYSVLADFKVTDVKTDGTETYPLWGYDPEGAQSWELSPDGSQITWKIRDGLKTDPRQPTNGRLYDSGDLEFSWKKFAALNARRGDLLNEVNSNSPVLSASFPDKQTMVWKLAFPSPVMLQKVNRFLMMTKEGDTSVPGGYDPLRDMRGTGPWMMSSYEPSVKITYEKNPNYWDAKNFPLLDKVDMFIISDTSQREAQFRAGRIDGSTAPASPPSTINPENRVQFKRENPNFQLVLDPTLPFGNGAGTWMDYRPGSPWLDVRLRRGLSMLIDRNLYIDTFLNGPGFAKDGIDVGKPQWHSHLNSPLKEFWLDPQKTGADGLGENGKYWKFDPAEARKMVSAARPLPVTGPFQSLSGNEYAPPYHQFAEVMLGMFNEGGIFKLTNSPVDYTTEFTPKMSVTGNPKGGHNFEGLAFGAIGGVTGGYSDPEATWGTHFTPGGTMYKFEENFVDQRFLDLNAKQAREMDDKKRIDLVKEAQRVCADWFPMILFPGLVKGVNLYQPWHGNAGATISRNNEAGGWNAHLKYRWLDKSKMST